MNNRVRRLTALTASLCFAVTAAAQTSTNSSAPPPAAEAFAPPYKIPNSRELKVKVRGGEIHVVVVGDLKGPRAPLMMVNGGPGLPHWEFLPALPLAQDRALILYDQLDTGKAQRPRNPANWTVERYASEIDAIRAALDVQEFHLLGHSWGSTVVNEYAGRRPAGLKSVVLESPFVSNRSWRNSTRERLNSLPQQVREAMLKFEQARDLENPLYEEARAVFFKNFFQRGATPESVKQYSKTFPRYEPNPINVFDYMTGGTEISITGQLENYDAEDLLTKYASPALLLCGEFDEISPKACGALAKRVPKGELKIISDAGHMIQYDQPQAYVMALKDWLARND